MKFFLNHCLRATSSSTSSLTSEPSNLESSPFTLVSLFCPLLMPFISVVLYVLFLYLTSALFVSQKALPLCLSLSSPLPNQSLFSYLCVPCIGVSSPCHIRHVTPFCRCCAVCFMNSVPSLHFLLPSHVYHARLPSHYSSRLTRGRRSRQQHTVAGRSTSVWIKRARRTSIWGR